MRARLCLTALRFLPFLLLGLILDAHAEPYLAVQMGLKCGVCHINPTGGGERTAYGEIFAQTVMPHEHVDTGDGSLWTGEINKFLSVGGDLRFQGSYTKVPDSPTLTAFDLEQARVYLDASVIPERFALYIDEQVAPGGALNREAYGMYWSASHEWYIKAGQMYLPFGLRLQDTSAFVQTTSEINMTTPDKGVELGWEHGPWDAQVSVSNGTAGGPATPNGKQYGGQLVFVQPIWRLGVAANDNMASEGGSRTAYSIFGGLRTGPISWLGEVVYVDDKSEGSPGTEEVSTLVEANWLIVKGNNLKLTAEYLDPNRMIGNNGQTRYSIVYELTPIQFLQLRAGFRDYNGIPQSPAQNERFAFIELHGFF